MRIPQDMLAASYTPLVSGHHTNLYTCTCACGPVELCLCIKCIMCVRVNVYAFPSCPLSYSKPVNLGVATSPPTVLKLGGGVVLEYSNGDVCKGQQKMKTTLILNCDKDTPIVSISLILVHV